MKQRVQAGGTLDIATKEEIAELLRDFGKSGHVAFGNDRIERIQENWPVMGHRRQIRVKSTHGSNNVVIAANAYTDIFPANHGRGGLSIINIGANPCFVFLGTAEEAQEQNGAIASGYIAANGDWDGKIGNAEWVGPVSVLSVLGTTLVTAEV